MPFAALVTEASPFALRTVVALLPPGCLRLPSTSRPFPHINPQLSDDPISALHCPPIPLSNSAFVPWTPGYNGRYQVMMWDSLKANLRLVAVRDTLEEAAGVFDDFSIAYHGAHHANTNYKPLAAGKEVCLLVPVD